MPERVYRIVIADLPEGHDRRELLELVLAAASLDLDLQLVLSDRALGLLGPNADPGWQQVLDQDLAEVLLMPAGRASELALESLGPARTGLERRVAAADVEIQA